MCDSHGGHGRVTTPCNCENLDCNHGESACEHNASRVHRIKFIGVVCAGCWANYPKEYRINVAS